MTGIGLSGPVTEQGLRAAYSTIMGRDADQDGLNYWMNSGVDNMQDVFNYFRQSDEAQERNAAALYLNQNGGYNGSIYNMTPDQIRGLAGQNPNPSYQPPVNNGGGQVQQPGGTTGPGQTTGNGNDNAWNQTPMGWGAGDWNTFFNGIGNAFAPQNPQQQGWMQQPIQTGQFMAPTPSTFGQFADLSPAPGSLGQRAGSWGNSGSMPASSVFNVLTR